MGGGVTWQYALRHPSRVDAMILIDSTGLPEWRKSIRTDGEARETPLAFRLLQQRWFRAIAARLDPYYLVKQGLESSYNYSPVVDDELIMRYYELTLRHGTRHAILKRFDRPFNATAAFDLSKLTQPTLVMWGKEDSLIPYQTASKFAEVLPNAKVIIYDGVGHIPMEEIPERSAEDVRQFLAGLTNRSDQAN